MGRSKLILASFLVSLSAHAQVQVWNQDLNGSTNANKVVSGIQNHAIAAPTSAGALAWTGSAWTYSNPAGFGFGTAGQFLLTNAAGTASLWATISNDIAASLTTPGSLSVQSITPTGGAGSTVVVTAAALQAATSVATLAIATNKSGGTLDLNAGTNVTVAALTSPSSTSTNVQFNSPNTSNVGSININDNGFFSINNSVNQISMNGSSGISITPYSASTILISDNGAVGYGQIKNSGWVVGPGANAGTFIQSATTNTSFGTGTNKSGAEYDLFADANVKILALLLASATFQSGVNVIVTAAHEDISQASAPSAPSAGTQRIYTDSADGKLKVIDAAGNITTLGI